MWLAIKAPKFLTIFPAKVFQYFSWSCVAATLLIRQYSTRWPWDSGTGAVGTPKRRLGFNEALCADTGCIAHYVTQTYSKVRDTVLHRTRSLPTATAASAVGWVTKSVSNGGVVPRGHCASAACTRWGMSQAGYPHLWGIFLSLLGIPAPPGMGRNMSFCPKKVGNQLSRSNEQPWETAL